VYLLICQFLFCQAVLPPVAPVQPQHAAVAAAVADDDTVSESDDAELLAAVVQPPVPAPAKAPVPTPAKAPVPAPTTPAPKAPVPALAKAPVPALPTKNAAIQAFFIANNQGTTPQVTTYVKVYFPVTSEGTIKTLLSQFKNKNYLENSRRIHDY